MVIAGNNYYRVYKTELRSGFGKSLREMMRVWSWLGGWHGVPCLLCNLVEIGCVTNAMCKLKLSFPDKKFPSIFKADLFEWVVHSMWKSASVMCSAARYTKIYCHNVLKVNGTFTFSWGQWDGYACLRPEVRFWTLRVRVYVVIYLLINCIALPCVKMRLFCQKLDFKCKNYLLTDKPFPGQVLTPRTTSRS